MPSPSETQPASETSAPIDGGPAFPNPGYMDMRGMSMRDWFAGQFLAGACAASNQSLNVSVAADQSDIDAALRAHWSCAARAAYIAADAMLAERVR